MTSHPPPNRRLLRLAVLGLLGAVVGFAVVIYLFAAFLAWLHG